MTARATLRSPLFPCDDMRKLIPAIFGGERQPMVFRKLIPQMPDVLLLGTLGYDAHFFENIGPN